MGYKIGYVIGTKRFPKNPKKNRGGHYARLFIFFFFFLEHLNIWNIGTISSDSSLVLNETNTPVHCRLENPEHSGNKNTWIKVRFGLEIGFLYI